jgi:hypothetical protein
MLISCERTSTAAVTGCDHYWMRILPHTQGEYEVVSPLHAWRQIIISFTRTKNNAAKHVELVWRHQPLCLLEGMVTLA